MRAVHDDLLALAEYLDLVRTSVRRNEALRQFFERFVRAQQDRALWCLADANQKLAALPEHLPRQALDRLRCRLYRDVDVDRRSDLAQDAGILVIGGLVIVDPEI